MVLSSLSTISFSVSDPSTRGLFERINRVKSSSNKLCDDQDQRPGGGANVKKDTLIGEGEAKRNATIAEALAEEQRMEAKLQNDTEIAKSKPLTTDPQQRR